MSATIFWTKLRSGLGRRREVIVHCIQFGAGHDERFEVLVPNTIRFEPSIWVIVHRIQLDAAHDVYYELLGQIMVGSK